MLYSLSKILFGSFLGQWSDRIGQRKIVAISLGLYLFVSVCYFFTTSLAVITILRLLQGVSCAMFRPVGILSDRAPRRSLVVAGGTIVSRLYFLIPAMGGFYQILLLGVGIGLFSVLSQPASTALLVEEGARHGMGVTVGTFNSAINLGFISGPLLGAGVQSTLGLAAVFYAAGILGLGAVALFVVNGVAGDEVPICQELT